uniref:Uncharacterized protein n=1 Tax=Cucumis melo TaxID=3656 RepID=A0A9I9E2A0_CUCME
MPLDEYGKDSEKEKKMRNTMRRSRSSPIIFSPPNQRQGCRLTFEGERLKKVSKTNTKSQ